MLPDFLNRFAKVGSVVALTVAMTVAALPARKASAQVSALTGAGASSITDLADLLVNIPGANNRYVVTGSGTGRQLFQDGLTDFVATDLTLPNVDGVVVNEAFLQVAFPFNVPGFDGQLTASQACSIVNGDITNWNEVGGPDLPIVRVVRGDNSGTSATLQAGFINPICNDQFGLGNQSFDPNNGAFLGFSNPQGNEIVVQPPADPFNSGDDLNSGSYSLGVISAVQNTPGAIGYVEDALAINRGVPLATNVESGLSTIAVGPTYVVFNRFYQNQDDVNDARAKCLAISNSDLLQSRDYIPGADAVSGGNTDLCNQIDTIPGQ